MTTIAALRRRFENLNVSEVSENSIDATKDQYKEQQRDQLAHGKRADGSQIGKYRNPAYARKKAAMNPLAGFGNVDLKLTGSYYKDLFVDVRSDVIAVDSSDSKAGDLEKKYGDPFGLGGEYRAKYIQALEPVFINKVKEIVKL